MILTQWQIICMQGYIKACVAHEMACHHDKSRMLQQEINAQVAMLKALQETPESESDG